jgi:hypothetical protein
MTKPQRWLTGVAITGGCAALAAAILLWLVFTSISR